MTFEKGNQDPEIMPLAQCSGCSDDGEDVYRDAFNAFQAQKAGRCS